MGLDWIIACLADLYHWNFRKQHFFKHLRENSKLLEITSRSNKGGLFVEISEYHNGARRGCLRVPKGTKIGLGKTTSGLEKKVVAEDGEFEKAVDMRKSQVWKKLKGHENKGSGLCFVKQFPNTTDHINQLETLGDLILRKIQLALVSQQLADLYMQIT